MRISPSPAFLALGSWLLIACGGSAPPAESPAAESPAPAAESLTPAAGSTSPATFAEQVSAGQQLYAAHCAECHGGSGEGSKGPRVVGLDQGALPLDPPAGAKYRKTQFKTVADIAAFVVASMPPNAPGSLKTEEYWSVLAFDLKANGIDLGDKKLDGDLAKTLDVPRK
jgi:mono/diheme cytochrome c family protein